MVKVAVRSIDLAEYVEPLEPTMTHCWLDIPIFLLIPPEKERYVRCGVKLSSCNNVDIFGTYINH